MGAPVMEPGDTTIFPAWADSLIVDDPGGGGVKLENLRTKGEKNEGNSKGNKAQEACSLSLVTRLGKVKYTEQYK